MVGGVNVVGPRNIGLRLAGNETLDGFLAIGGNKERQSDNYREQSHRCYPNDQKRQCGRVVVEPMFVHAHEDCSPCKNERVMNAALKGKQTVNLLLQPRHT
jgi:hypothetical protein